jgi:hypothetical protein
VDAIVHVLRCFEGGDVTHVENRVDPVADAEIVETELMLADLGKPEKRVPNLAKKAAQGDKEAKVQASVLGQALELLRDSKPARLTEPRDAEEKLALDAAQLLTAKPVSTSATSDEGDAAEGNAHSARGVRARRGEGARGRDRVGGDRGGDRHHGAGGPRRVPVRPGAHRDRPRPRDPRRIRPPPPHHLLHRRPQGSARLDGRERAPRRRRPPA